jgi:membrane protease YdiL (CAAX protease family)
VQSFSVPSTTTTLAQTGGGFLGVEAVGNANEIKGRHVLLAVLLATPAFLVSGFITVAALHQFSGAGTAHSLESELPGMKAIGPLITSILAMPVVVLAWMAVGRGALRTSGLSGLALLRPSVRHLVVSSVVGVVLALGAVVSVWVWPVESSSYLITQARSAGTIGVVVVFVSLVLTAPVLEEFFFRGLISAAVFRRFGFWSAFGVSTLCFGAMHLPTTHASGPGMVFTTALGGVAWAARVRFSSLFCAMALHASYNAVVVASDVWLK